MDAIVTLTMNPALDIATSTDRVLPTHKLRCAAPRYDPGGGGINVARAVHALGGNAVAIAKFHPMKTYRSRSAREGNRSAVSCQASRISQIDQNRCLD